MRKAISILLTLFILISSFGIISSAENKAVLKLTGETVYAGEEFKLNLFISDNSKMSGAVIDINYDNKMLEYVSADYGAILDETAQISIKNLKNESSKVRFTYLAPNSEVTSEGVIMIITFKALENAVGETDLTISIPNSGDFITQSLERISYDVENSVVKIINTTHSVSDESDNTSENEAQSSENVDKTDPSTGEASNDVGGEQDDTFDSDILAIAGAFVIGVLCIVLGAIRLKKKNKQNQ